APQGACDRRRCSLGAVPRGLPFRPVRRGRPPDAGAAAPWARGRVAPARGRGAGDGAVGDRVRRVLRAGGGGRGRAPTNSLRSHGGRFPVGGGQVSRPGGRAAGGPGTRSLRDSAAKRVFPQPSEGNPGGPGSVALV